MAFPGYGQHFLIQHGAVIGIAEQKCPAFSKMAKYLSVFHGHCDLFHGFFPFLLAVAAMLGSHALWL